MAAIRLACKVAIASLQVLKDEDLAGRAEKMGQYFRTAVADIGSPYIKEVRGKGLLNAIVIRHAG
jgi:ornithine--oxo-acid transaminase